MLLEDIATIRTGVVTTRKRVSEKEKPKFVYKVLNLKCMLTTGQLDLRHVEDLPVSQELKNEFFTRNGDIIVRLSSPYTVIMINRDEWCGYLVPSHFAIIRVDESKACPEYILWLLKRDSTKQKILQNISGAGVFGTINSGFFNTLSVRPLTFEKQKAIGNLQLLAEREQDLLHRLMCEKDIYNRNVINKIYENVKRGN